MKIEVEIALLCFLLITSLVVGVAFVGAARGAVTVYDIDDDHDLFSDDAVREYKETGEVSTQLLVPDLRISIVSTSQAAGVEGFRADAPWHYVRLQYNETLAAEFRIYFPSGYWHPHPQDMKAINDDSVEAELREVDEETSRLTVRLDGRSDVVFAVPRAASVTFATRDHGYDFVENRSGLELPEIRSRSDPWSYVDQAAISENTTVAIQKQDDRKLLVQYDAGDFEERWINAPDCEARTGKDEPVCVLRRTGDDNRIYVLSRTADPPPVRFKYDAGPMTQVKNLQHSLEVTLERAMAWIGGLFGTVIHA
jgi:hypothetical protein